MKMAIDTETGGLHPGVNPILTAAFVNTQLNHKFVYKMQPLNGMIV